MVKKLAPLKKVLADIGNDTELPRKECSGCRLPLPLSLFSANARLKGGLCSRCKYCVSTYQKLRRKQIADGTYVAHDKPRLTDEQKAAKRREYERARYQRNADAIKASARSWASKNKERIKATKQAYYLANRDKILEYQKDYAQKNKDKIGERGHQYREANRDHIKARYAAYAASPEGAAKIKARSERYRLEYAKAISARYQANLEANRRRNADRMARDRLARPEHYKALNERHRQITAALGDVYVRGVLADELGVSARLVPPELIEAKREVIAMRRALRELNHSIKDLTSTEDK